MLSLLSAAALSCTDSHVVEPAEQPGPDEALEEGCPHWLLVERTGTFPSYERRVHDEQARLVRRESGGVARSASGEFHLVVEFTYGDGHVTLESEGREALDRDDVDAFTEVTELDDLGRPVRILGWDSPELSNPNRTVDHEYDAQGRLSVRHQQEHYDNGGAIDRRCSFEYGASGYLDARTCEGTHPDTKRYGWNEDGNLLFSELEAETFTSRTEYEYEGLQLSSVLWEDFSRHDFRYDAQRRLVWHEYKRFDGGGDGVGEYEYDAQGRMTQRHFMSLDGSNQQTTSYLYDEQGRLVEVVSDVTPRSYHYEQSETELTVTERWGGEVFETRRYECSPTPTTGMPVDMNPEPFGGRDPVLPHQISEPRPFPDEY